MKTFSILLAGLVCFLSINSQAADKPVKVKPSKVSSAKSREREKLFTDWMTAAEIRKLSDSKRESGEQLLYFEYHEGKEKFRAIFSKAIQFNGWWWNSVYGEKEMENFVNEYKQKGFEPLFVVLEGNYYSVLMVKGDQLDAARKVLEPLGIEAPVLK